MASAGSVAAGAVASVSSGAHASSVVASVLSVASADMNVKQQEIMDKFNAEVQCLVNTLPDAKVLKATYIMKCVAEEKALAWFQAERNKFLQLVKDMNIILRRKLLLLAEHEFVTVQQSECATLNHWYAMLELLHALPWPYDLQALNEDHSAFKIFIHNDA